MPTENCAALFKFPILVVDIYNNLGSQGYSDDDIFSIATHLSFLCHGIQNNVEKCKVLTQTAIDVTTLFEAFNKTKLC